MKTALCLLLLFAGGCTQIQMLPYLDQVMTLQDFGRDKAAQEKLVDKIDADFDKLQQSIARGEIKKYKTEKSIVKAFGPPIISEDAVIEGKILKQSLYRYALQKKGPHKIHFYYNKQGDLVNMESL